MSREINWSFKYDCFTHIRLGKGHSYRVEVKATNRKHQNKPPVTVPWPIPGDCPKCGGPTEKEPLKEWIKHLQSRGHDGRKAIKDNESGLEPEEVCGLVREKRCPSKDSSLGPTRPVSVSEGVFCYVNLRNTVHERYRVPKPHPVVCLLVVLLRRTRDRSCYLPLRYLPKNAVPISANHKPPGREQMLSLPRSPWRLCKAGPLNSDKPGSGAVSHDRSKLIADALRARQTTYTDPSPARPLRIPPLGKQTSKDNQILRSTDNQCQ